MDLEFRGACWGLDRKGAMAGRLEPRRPSVICLDGGDGCPVGPLGGPHGEHAKPEAVHLHLEPELVLRIHDAGLGAAVPHGVDLRRHDRAGGPQHLHVGGIDEDRDQLPPRLHHRVEEDGGRRRRGRHPQHGAVRHRRAGRVLQPRCQPPSEQRTLRPGSVSGAAALRRQATAGLAAALAAMSSASRMAASMRAR